MKHFIEDYNAPRNEEIETLLKDIGRTINAQMPQGWGFTLLIYTYKADSMFYISSGERNGMLKSLEELLTNLRKSNQ
jgi:hypothetical protein